MKRAEERLGVTDNLAAPNQSLETTMLSSVFSKLASCLSRFYSRLVSMCQPPDNSAPVI
jgi:hypothetical protein